MDKMEFDKFADEYLSIHRQNIKASGEDPAFFAEYKVAEVAMLTKKWKLEQAPQILDFGSGVGNAIPYFHKYFPSCKLVCTDVSERSLLLSQERYPQMAQYALFNGTALPFANETFDVIFSACVFHHIEQGSHCDLLAELRRILAANGLLVIFEHNPWNPLTVHAVNTCPFDENAVLLKPRLFAETFSSAGLTPLGVKYKLFFPRALRYLRGLERWMTWLPLGAQYYIFAKK